MRSPSMHTSIFNFPPSTNQLTLLSLPPPPAVNLDTLAPEQLSQVKKQLDDELEHLTNSYAQLHGAQAKFKDCYKCIQTRTSAQGGESRNAANVQCVLGEAEELTWSLLRVQLYPSAVDQFSICEW